MKATDLAVNLGWKIDPKDSNGVIVLNGKDNESISYPQEMYELKSAEDGFWVNQRARHIIDTCRAFEISQFVEVGAGTGSVCIPLTRSGVSVTAIEPIYAGAKIIASEIESAICSTLEQANFPSECISNVGIFDVLEHIEKTSEILSEIKRILVPGGHLIVTVPCGNWLWGDIDESLGHFRRYSMKQLKKELNNAGFLEVKTQYLFLSLVFPALLMRAIPYRFGIHRRKQSVINNVSSNQSPNRCVNWIMNMILTFESKLLKSHSPYGLSILAVYTKPLLRKMD
jgi:SAM-dependent methyltransferase